MKKENERTLFERFRLPPETIPNTPLIQVREKRSVCIENHGGILEYTDSAVKVAVKRGAITVYGDGLTIARMTRRIIEIRGCIRSLELE